MADDDVRIARWNLRASAGVTESIEFVSPVALESLSIYVGGTTTDVDDLTDATGYTATLGTTKADGEVVGADRVATVTLTVPTTTSVPLRLVVDGAVETVGRLTPSTTGSDLTDATIELSAGTRTYELTVIGQRGPQGEPGATGATGPAGAIGPTGPAGSDAEVTAGNVAAAGAVMTTGAQTVAGVKTFSSSPVVPDGVAAGDAVNKGQLDAASGASLAVDAAAEASGAQIAARQRFLRAGDFALGQAGPVQGLAASRWPIWILRDANVDRINAVFENFSPGGTVDIDVLWANTGTGSGNVAFKLFFGPHNLTDISSDASRLTTYPLVYAPAEPVTNKLCRTRLATAVDMTTAMMGLVMMERSGADAGDTLAASINVVGVIVTENAPYDGTLTGDGAWCWFNEPRLLAHQGTANKVYGSYVTNVGSVGVAELDVDTGDTAEFILKANFEQDDHDVPGLVVMPDGDVLAFYSRHSILNDPIYYRRTTVAEDVSAWDAEGSITLPAGAKPCYPKPALVGSRLYVFFRNNESQDFIYSDDGGATWSTPTRLISYTGGKRGYVNICASADRVDFITTDGHPNNDDTDLFHFYLSGGNLYETDGTLITAMSSLTSTVGIAPTDATLIYDQATAGDAWGWDIQRDGSGNPVVVFANFPTTTDHRYRYARWTGAAWSVNEIVASGGGTIAERGSEPHYSGGIGLLSSDTNVVYLSRLVESQWEVWRYTTSDQGASWSGEAITRYSPEKQIRPTTPDGHFEGAPEVFWMAGYYTHYEQYGTRIVWSDPTA